MLFYFSEISVENFTLESDDLIELDQIFVSLTNLQALEAALTSMIQNNEKLVGSFVEIIDGSSFNSTLNLRLSITTNQSDSNVSNSKWTNILGQNDRTTPDIRYDYFNGTMTTIRWMKYQLPDEIQSST